MDGLFRSQVLKIVSEIPEGRVMTYGGVAAAAGSPRAARSIGAILRSLTLEESEIPWWRVLNRDGYLSISQGNQGMAGIEKEIQKDHLEADGVTVDDDYQIDLVKYMHIQRPTENDL